MLTDAELLRMRIARHHHAEEVLTSVINNESLMRQVRESLESYKRGEPDIPMAQLLGEMRAQRGER